MRDREKEKGERVTVVTGKGNANHEMKYSITVRYTVVIQCKKTTADLFRGVPRGNFRQFSFFFISYSANKAGNLLILR